MKVLTSSQVTRLLYLGGLFINGMKQKKTGDDIFTFFIFAHDMFTFMYFLPQFWNKQLSYLSETEGHSSP